MLGVACFDEASTKLFFERVHDPNQESDVDEKAAATIWTAMTNCGFLHVRISDHDPYVETVHSSLSDLLKRTRGEAASSASQFPLEELRAKWFDSRNWANETSKYVDELRKLAEGLPPGETLKDKEKRWLDRLPSSISKEGDENREKSSFYYWLSSKTTEKLFDSLGKKGPKALKNK